MIELAAAVVSIGAAGVGLYGWLKRRGGISDKWVNPKYIEKSGIKAKLEASGFRICWSAANKYQGRVDLEGWEVVVEKDSDRKRVRFKCKDHNAVGGYIILLKKPNTD